jgi:hypothetical protein
MILCYYIITKHINIKELVFLSLRAPYLKYEKQDHKEI